MACIEVGIVNALATRLATITTANGYLTGIGSRIYETEPEPEEDPTAPFLVIGGIESEALIAEAADWTMRVELDAYADVISQGYETARDQALNALRDIERALRANTSFASYILQARVDTKTLPRRQAGSHYLVATASVAIDYLDED
jgi:hypothetical protein